MKGGYYVVGVLAVLALLGAVYAPATLSQVGLLSDHEKNESAPPDDHDWPDQDDNETWENQSAAAPAMGGGGWFAVKVGSVTFKDTFGMFITGNKSLSNMSSFVIQGRDVATRIHSVNFTKITFSNNNRTVQAAGWCTANGVRGYWFNLTATDMGNRSSDVLHVWVYKDANNSWTMDEATPTWVWLVNGLGGGQISAGDYEEQSDETNRDDDDFDTDDDLDHDD